VIDLSADFRLKSAEVYREFYAHDHPAPDLLGKSVYGLPEIYREEIRKSVLIASPGCYPTSILLPAMPLLQAELIKPAGIIADSLSGVSGAGRKAELDYLFCECNESVRPYSVPKHRHLSEIEEQLSLAAGTKVTIQFTPHLIPVNRGILTTLYLTPEKPFSTTAEMNALNKRILACYTEAYAGTNVIEIAWRLDPRTGRLIVMSAEDNLIKGASGQAIQSMNLVCGFPETAGLV
jgi:N-acetyl-gamma-glutamyl-phosphate reductase